MTRNRIDLWTPAEKAIYDAMQEIEKLGADEKLTEAVLLLQKAKELVSKNIEAKGDLERAEYKKKWLNK